MTSWQTFCHHAMFLSNFLTSWHLCWRHDMFWHHDELCNFLTNLLTSWRVFDVTTHLSMLWHLFDFMTNCFDIYLMSWQILWRHGVFLMSLTCFWRVFDIMTNFLKHVALIDVMKNVLMSWKFLTTWHTFYVLTYDMFFFTLWRKFCCDDIFLSLFWNKI